LSTLQVETTNGGFVLTSSRGGSFGPLASLRSFWTRNGNKQIYGAYERPPFPIQIDAPNWGEVLKEIRFCDLFMGFSIYGAGIFTGYFASRPFPMLMQRLIVYHGISHMFLATAFALTIAVPYRRLTGFWDNGLRWKKPEDKLNKFDSTSHFEAATVWHRFRRDGKDE